ncbi:sensor histidine kinase [Micromonospora sp. NPDC047670]|uniref:sensor histidine kinase n=1 Tax=Micromonospora sp. NPDC047670 TaxID=3364252 RepID=UPI0037245787
MRFQLDGTAVRLPTPHEVALLRIAQSALANTVRHAGATRAEVTLRYGEHGVVLEVVDDDGGFDPGDVVGRGGGFGLAAMRARAGELGGTLTVASSPGGGTALAVRFAHPSTEGTPAGT